VAVSVVDVQVRTGGAVKELNRLEQASKGAAASIASLVSTLGAGFALQQIVRTTSQFESVLSEIGKTAGASEKEITKLAESLKQLSAPSKTNLAPTVLAEGVKDLVAQGLKLNDAVASMETLGKVAVATNSELTDVTKTGFQLQSALKIRPNELKQTFDALAFAGKAGAFELKDMAQFMPTIASAATSLGIRGKEGAVALAAMMQMVRKDAPGAAEASTRLTDALLKMTAPETVKNFKKFGVDIEKVLKDAVAKGVNPMDAAIKELIRVTGKDTFKLSQIFGDKEAKLALMALMKYKKEYEELKAAAGGAAAAGTVQKDFEASLKTFNGQLQTLQSSGELLALSLGRTLLPVLSRFIEELVPLANGIAEFVQGIGQLPKPVLDAVVEVTKLVIQITLLKKFIGLIVGAAALFKGAMALLTAQTAMAGAAALTGNAKLVLLQGGITGTGRVAAIAAPLVNTLAASLRALSVIGIVTTGINYVSNVVGEAKSIEELQKRRAAGGAAAAFKGATRETVVSAQAGQRKALLALQKKEEERQKKLAKSSPLFQIPVVGPLALTAMSPFMAAEQTRISEEQQFARGVLGLNPSNFKPEATTQSNLDDSSGVGIDPLTKQKNKKPRESQVPELTRELALLKQQTQLQGLLAQAAITKNEEDRIRLEGIGRETELLHQAYAIEQSSVPLAEKQIGIAKIAEQLKQSQIQTAQELAMADKQKAIDAAKAVEAITAEIAYKQNILTIGQQEADIRKRINDLVAQGVDPKVAEDRVRAEVEVNNQLLERQFLLQQEQQLLNAIGTTFTSTITGLIQGTNDFNSSLQNVLKSLGNLLIQAGLQGLAGNDGRGFFSFLSGSLGRRAMGGSVTAGQGYLVGERGPELFMPGRSGGIAPAGGFGGGANIVVNVDANGTSAGGDSSKAGQLGKVVAAAVQAELVKQRRPGGILA
jgi:TP901 family phage tail tape measure protein